MTGSWLVALPGHWGGGAPRDAGGLPLNGWARDDGDPRAVHFFRLHLMQALSLAAFALTAVGATPPATTAERHGAAAAGAAATLSHALAGRPFQ